VYPVELPSLHHPTNEFARIAEIMRRHGALSTAEEFHAAVNVTFHKYESEQYDTLHADMWESLPEQMQLLVQDVLNAAPKFPEQIRLLDIGCGTGLATDCFMRTPLGPRVRTVDLIDTSASMLRRAAARAKTWDIPVQQREGIVESIPGEGMYDAIITCSVLHHVPDLPSFMRAVRRLQASGGVFIHLQDPNGDFMNDPQLRQRTAQASTHLPEWVQRLAPRRILGRLYRELTGTQGKDYVSKTNRELVENGIIQEPLTVAELFAITDIHVHDDQGISIRDLSALLPDYDLIRQRSYGFFGRLWSTLPPDLKRIEERLIAENALNGGHVAAAWMLRA
jgi:2-polyprenyl-3-methyl-5-hydroxy-6-metoxy-1,4-benzoquinol methylase